MNKYLIFFCSLLFCLTACKKEDKTLRKIEGIVTDFYSGNPVSGATVFLEDGRPDAATTTTGLDGYYQLDYDTENCDAEGLFLRSTCGVIEEELIEGTYDHFCSQVDKIFDITVTTYGYIKSHAINVPPANDSDVFTCASCHSTAINDKFYGADIDTIVIQKIPANWKESRWYRLNNEFVSLDSFIVTMGDTLEFEYFY